MQLRKFYTILLVGLALLLNASSAIAQYSFIPNDWHVDSSVTTSVFQDTLILRDTVHFFIHDTVFTEKSDSLTIESIGDEANKGLKKIGQIISFGKIFWSIIFLIFSYFMIRLSVYIIEGFAERSTSYRFMLKSISPFIKIIGWMLAIFIVVQGIIHPPMETLYAFLASFGIAVGFASQDILKNIFGGVMILFDRPFQVGDKIQVGEHYGEVIEIGLRSTRIVTKDDSMISVPNAEVVNTAVSNSNSGEANCQVVAEIYLPIDVNTNRARQLGMEAARVSRYVYLNKPIQVMFVNEVKQRRSYLKMRLKAYVSDIRYEFAFQSDMTEIVMTEMLKEGLINKDDLS